MSKGVDVKSAVLGFVAAVGLAVLAACGVSTGSNIDFDASDLQYGRDARTGKCFAFVGSGKSMSVETTGMGLAQVECDDAVMEQVK